VVVFRKTLRHCSGLCFAILNRERKFSAAHLPAGEDSFLCPFLLVPTFATALFCTFSLTTPPTFSSLPPFLLVPQDFVSFSFVRSFLRITPFSQFGLVVHQRWFPFFFSLVVPL